MSGRNFVFCLIIVAIFIRLERAYRLREWWGGGGGGVGVDFEVIKWGQAMKGRDHFYGGS